VNPREKFAHGLISRRNSEEYPSSLSWSLSPLRPDVVSGIAGSSLDGGRLQLDRTIAGAWLTRDWWAVSYRRSPTGGLLRVAVSAEDRWRSGGVAVVQMFRRLGRCGSHQVGGSVCRRAPPYGCSDGWVVMAARRSEVPSAAACRVPPYGCSDGWVVMAAGRSEVPFAAACRRTDVPTVRSLWQPPGRKIRPPAHAAPTSLDGSARALNLTTQPSRMRVAWCTAGWCATPAPRASRLRRSHQ